MKVDEIADMRLIFDHVRNKSIGFFLLKTGELKSFFIESNLSLINPDKKEQSESNNSSQDSKQKEQKTSETETEENKLEYLMNAIISLVTL